MKALVFRGPFRMSWEERPDPIPGPLEAVVEVRAVGVCGSDLHGYSGESRRRTPGLAMGHEATGRVLAVGEDVSRNWLGRRVAILPIQACNRCDQCSRGHVNRCRNRRFLGMNVDGAMAEKLAVPIPNLFPLADQVSYEHGTLAEPLAVSIHAIRQAGNLAGQSVLVAGAGPIGLLTVVAAKRHGARAIFVTARRSRRREIAVKLGADGGLDPTIDGWEGQISNSLGTGEVDLAVDAAGTGATLEQALRAVRPGGTVIALGGWQSLPLDSQSLVSREVRMVGSFNFTLEEFREAGSWLAGGHFDPAMLVTDLRPISQGAAVLDELVRRPSDAIKVVLTAQPH